MFSDPGLHDNPTSLPAADGRAGAGRLSGALIAYVSVLSASVAAAAALISVGIPV